MPFALAALMPVNLCGLFISLFIEGDALIAVLAVLTVALNALLMLAYLPSYRGVLQGGQLADGEGPEEGRNYESLFVNPLGNAPPGPIPAPRWCWPRRWRSTGGSCRVSNGLTGVVMLAMPTLLLAIGWVRALGRGRGG